MPSDCSVLPVGQIILVYFVHCDLLVESVNPVFPVLQESSSSLIYYVQLRQKAVLHCPASNYQPCTIPSHAIHLHPFGALSLKRSTASQPPYYSVSVVN